MKPSLIAILLLVAHAGFSQNTSIGVSSFDKLKVFGPFKVNLIKSEKAYAEFDFHGLDKEDFICEVRRETLELRFKNKHFVNDLKDRRNSRYVEVNVYYTDIDEIEASAGAIVRSVEQIKSKYLILDCNMGAEVILDVYAKKIEATSRMGALLEMKGRTTYLDVKATTGGMLKAGDLESKTTFVKANTGADVFVSASEELEAFAGFGANVDYTGGPAVRNTSRSFGGEVHRKDKVIRIRRR